MHSSSEARGFLTLEFTRPDGMKLSTVIRGDKATDQAAWPPGPLGVTDHFRKHAPRALNDAERQILKLWSAQAERIDKELRLSEEHLS